MSKITSTCEVIVYLVFHFLGLFAAAYVWIPSVLVFTRFNGYSFDQINLLIRSLSFCSIVAVMVLFVFCRRLWCEVESTSPREVLAYLGTHIFGFVGFSFIYPPLFLSARSNGWTSTQLSALGTALSSIHIIIVMMIFFWIRQIAEGHQTRHYYSEVSDKRSAKVHRNNKPQKSEKPRSSIKKERLSPFDRGYN